MLKYSQVLLKNSPKWQHYTEENHQSEFKLTKDTLYLTIMGKLWGVFIVRNLEKMSVF